MENSKEKTVKNNQGNIFKIIGVVLAVLLSVVAIFFLGRLTASEGRMFNKRPANLALNEFGPERAGRGFDKQHAEKRFFRETIEGEIIKIDGDILTFEDSGDEYTIKILDETSIYQDRKIAKKSDLKVGNEISVLGPSNSDGQIQARIIEIN